MGRDNTNGKIIIDKAYPGYVFLGWAKGNMETDDHEKRPYFNMYVLSPVSTWTSEDYTAFGFKAEKKKCLGEVWAGLEPGDPVTLFFDDRGRIQMAVLDGPGKAIEQAE